jgi:molecular chaperone GrpE
MDSENTVNPEVQTKSEDVQVQALEKCKIELTEWKDRALRISADFENYKRRMAKDQENLYFSLQADTLGGILDIVDNFDRALNAEQAQGSLEGFKLIYKELTKFLEKSGVKEISQVTTFDPELHEAIGQVDSDTHESGSIVSVLQKGYTLRDKVLRPAKVMIAR